MNQRRPSRIEDVAARAGVSVATVSRALRGLPNVAPHTRARVVEAAAELRYQPDPSAARLATGRSRTVAMAVPSLESWYFTRVMAAAERVLAAVGYDLLVLAVHDEDHRHRTLTGPLVRRAEGLILVNMLVPVDEVEVLSRAGVGLVSVGTEVENASLVAIDDYALARTAIGHLADLGHRRIGLIGGERRPPLQFVVPERRRAGYCDEMADRGIVVDPADEVMGEFTVDGGHRAARRLLRRPDPPTAIFALSDEMAFGAIRAIREAGLEIPGGVSIVGVDDHEFSAVVGLTTIAQDVRAHGTMAARILLAQLDDPTLPPQCHEAGTNLILRSTTGPIASRSVAEHS